MLKCLNRLFTKAAPLPLTSSSIIAPNFNSIEAPSTAAISMESWKDSMWVQQIVLIDGSLHGVTLYVHPITCSPSRIIIPTISREKPSTFAWPLAQAQAHWVWSCNAQPCLEQLLVGCVHHWVQLWILLGESGVNKSPFAWRFYIRQSQSLDIDIFWDKYLPPWWGMGHSKLSFSRVRSVWSLCLLHWQLFTVVDLPFLG